jgi:hypothetical protein
MEIIVTVNKLHCRPNNKITVSHYGENPNSIGLSSFCPASKLQ